MEHTIWSNLDLNIEDWREDFKMFRADDGIDEDFDDDELYDWMENTNADYLDDERANLNVEVLPPESVASLGSADVVLSAVVGIGGLTCAVKALEAGKKLALANKEVVVTAGRLLKNIAKKSGGELIPVDSEHSAIFQCLKLGDKKELSSVTLTASGGAFRDFDQKMLETVTPEMATVHPVWKMGKKVTVDSATLMNKGLEVVEAARFFDLPASKIKVLMHRESVIHGMASFTDGSVVSVL